MNNGKANNNKKSSPGNVSFYVVMLGVVAVQSFIICHLMLERDDWNTQLNQHKLRDKFVQQKQSNKEIMSLSATPQQQQQTTVNAAAVNPKKNIRIPTHASDSFADVLPAVVGSFNNHSLTFHSQGDDDKTTATTKEKRFVASSSNAAAFASTVQCVGENFNARDAWMYRSCEFSNLCFDTVEHDFVYVVTEEQQSLQQRLHEYNVNTEQARQKTQDYDLKNPVTVATSFNYNHSAMSLGGLNPNWQEKRDQAIEEGETEHLSAGLAALKWFPRTLSQEEFRQLSPEGHYMLPNNAVLIPFHSFGGMNVGHLLWDDFLPLYNLLSIFGYVVPYSLSSSIKNEQHNNRHYQPVLLRQGILKGEPKALWATCDLRAQSKQRCQGFFTKFLPLLGTSWDQFSTTEDARLTLHPVEGGSSNMANNPSSHSHSQSRFVCARHAVAGMGMLTDHGLKKHGWNKEDYHTMHNHGRGDTLYEFRNFMMSNMGFTREQIYLHLLQPADADDTNNGHSSKQPAKVVVSRMSSKSEERRHDYQVEMDAIKKTFSPLEVQLKPTVFLYHSAQEQMEMVSDASIMITSAGGGAVTAMFLPRGASLIVYYDEGSEDDPTVESGHLDWDYLNDLGYIRIHWLPIRRMQQKHHTEMLMELIRTELDFIRRRSNM
jgi:hypothetical protein